MDELLQLNSSRAHINTSDYATQSASSCGEHIVLTVSFGITDQPNVVTRIVEAQKQEAEFRIILQWMEEFNDKPPWQEVASYNVAVKTYWGLWESLKIHDGKLYRCLDSGMSVMGRWQLVVPQLLRKKVFEQFHGSPSCGHFGVTKTHRERFFWPRCRQSVEEWCRKCEKCAASKGPGKKQNGPMKQFNVGAPLERVALDILGPLPTSVRGNKYILIVGDYFMKWVEAYPLENQKAETVAEVFVREFVSRFGVPLQLHSDQGRNFENARY